MRKLAIGCLFLAGSCASTGNVCPGGQGGLGPSRGGPADSSPVNALAVAWSATSLETEDMRGYEVHLWRDRETWKVQFLQRDISIVGGGRLFTISARSGEVLSFVRGQ
jgi:hypothetical protein